MAEEVRALSGEVGPSNPNCLRPPCLVPRDCLPSTDPSAVQPPCHRGALVTQGPFPTITPSLSTVRFPLLQHSCRHSDRNRKEKTFLPTFFLKGFSFYLLAHFYIIFYSKILVKSSFCHHFPLSSLPFSLERQSGLLVSVHCKPRSSQPCSRPHVQPQGPASWLLLAFLILAACSFPASFLTPPFWSLCVVFPRAWSSGLCSSPQTLPHCGISTHHFSPRCPPRPGCSLQEGTRFYMLCTPPASLPGPGA